MEVVISSKHTSLNIYKIMVLLDIFHVLTHLNKMEFQKRKNRHIVETD